MFCSELTEFKHAGSQCYFVQHTRQDRSHDQEAAFLDQLCAGEYAAVFPHAFLEANEAMMGKNVKNLIIEHLKQLAEQLRKYFPSVATSHMWIRNPIEASLPNPQLSFHE